MTHTCIYVYTCSCIQIVHFKLHTILHMYNTCIGMYTYMYIPEELMHPPKCCTSALFCKKRHAEMLITEYVYMYADNRSKNNLNSDLEMHHAKYSRNKTASK